MQSYTFKELSERAKVSAKARYYEDQAISELVAELRESGDTLAPVDHVFLLANWRYNEHGERVA